MSKVIFKPCVPTQPTLKVLKKGGCWKNVPIYYEM